MSDLQKAIAAARLGGKAALSRYGKPLASHSKGGVDFYTEADLAAERAARGYLGNNSSYPVFGEEEGGDRKAQKLWVLDGIDGSPNWRAGIPLWGTMLCLLDGPFARVCAFYLPALGGLYYAERGKGTFRAGRPARRLRVTRETDPTKLLIATDVGYKGREWKLDKLKRIVQEVRYAPVYGSAAFSLVSVAEGRLGGDVIWDVDINDTCAGALLVEEAGGLAVNERGERFSRQDRTLIAAGNEAIKDFMLERMGK